MTDFTLHTVDSCPQDSQPLLHSSIRNFGWIPNQSALMAQSPGLLKSYQLAHEQVIACSLNEAEKTVVWLSVGLLHHCQYTQDAHVFIARKNAVDESLIQALLQHQPLPEKLECLRSFTQAITLGQGQVAPQAVDAFLQAGFTRTQILEVILAVAQKFMSTTMNHITHTATDAQFTVNPREEVPA